MKNVTIIIVIAFLLIGCAVNYEKEFIITETVLTVVNGPIMELNENFNCLTIIWKKANKAGYPNGPTTQIWHVLPTDKIPEDFLGKFKATNARITYKIIRASNPPIVKIINFELL